MKKKPEDHPLIPFVRWAGGKTRSLDAILPHIPVKIRRYREPFLGGGAVFLAVIGNPERKVSEFIVGDASPHLIETWESVARGSSLFTAMLASLESDEFTMEESQRQYLATRQSYNAQTKKGTYSITFPEQDRRAARFIYLNKAGFNGLWRVNRAGECNVPWGKRTNVSLDVENIRSVGASLLGFGVRSRFRHGDFARSMASAKKGDVVYLDPPYHGTFTGYTKDGFTFQDQQRLVLAATLAVDRGAKVICSQGENEEVAALWRTPTFEEHGVRVRGSISVKVDERRKYSERLFVSR